jgi:Mg/Co/Ni transporter MgtE
MFFYVIDKSRGSVLYRSSAPVHAQPGQAVVKSEKKIRVSTAVYDARNNTIGEITESEKARIRRVSSEAQDAREELFLAAEEDLRRLLENEDVRALVDVLTLLPARRIREVLSESEEEEGEPRRRRKDAREA